MTTTNPTTSPSAGGNAVSTGGNATPPAAPPVTLTIDGVQVSVPLPASSRRRIPTSQNVPSRHGVHLPQDSCL